MRAPGISSRRSSGLRALLADLTRSDTGRAAGLGAAVIAQNVLALVFTVIFARILGATGYGSLAVLVSAYIILMVPGSALQIAVAREVSRERVSGSERAGAGAQRWLTRLVAATFVVALLAIPARSLIGGLIDVDELWGAAAVPVTAMLWMILCLERGVLQGFEQYRTVGLSFIAEAGLRIVFALALFGVGLDVTGAFLGNAAAFIALALLLSIPLGRRLPSGAPNGDEPRLRDLLSGAAAPVIALTLLLALQELHIIIIKHEASDDAASSYAVAVVAAKGIIWIAVGLGTYLVPEAARRAAMGEDARPILVRTLALIAGAGIPMVLIYSMAGEPLLAAVFGDDLTLASDALPWLGLAMVMLACAYLAAQFQLALHRRRFIWVLAVGVLVEVVSMVAIGADLVEVALALVAILTACAVAVLFMALGSPPAATERRRVTSPVMAEPS